MTTLLPFEKEKELRLAIMDAYLAHLTYPIVNTDFSERIKAVEKRFPDVTRVQFNSVHEDVRFYITEKKVW